MKPAAPFVFVLAATATSALAAQPVPVIDTASPPPPTPPVIIAPPVAPPMPTIRSAPSKPLPPVQFQVEVMGGNERLWAGALRIANYSTASFNTTITEAPETCPADKGNLGFYAPGFTRSVRVSLARRGYGKDGAFSVSAQWTRPGAPCEEGSSLSVSFDRTFSLEPGEKGEFKGDGGLVVRITRLK